MNNGIFKLTLSDVQKGIIMAVLSGAFLPVAAIIQTPGFSFATANWSALGNLALTGALVGFAGYLVKNFFSTSDGSFAGFIGKPKQ